MAESGVSATANRAATGAVIAVLLVVGLVVALMPQDDQPPGGGSAGFAQGDQDAAGQQAGGDGALDTPLGDGQQQDGRQQDALQGGQGSNSASDSASSDASSSGASESGSTHGDPSVYRDLLAASSGGNNTSDDTVSNSAYTPDSQQDSSGGDGKQDSSSSDTAADSTGEASTGEDSTAEDSTGSGNNTSDSDGSASNAADSDDSTQMSSSDAGTAAAQTAGGARIVGKKRIDDQMLDLTIYSPALGHKTGVRLLLPRDWSSDPDRSWPTLYMLPGYHHNYDYAMGDYGDWTYYTDIEQVMADKNVLTVFPSDAGTGNFTNWRSGGKYGQPAWETYHTEELPALLESTYRASSNRAIGGLSLAGYGAVEYAADNPDMYNGVASYSGLLHTQFPGAPLLLKRMWKGAGIDPDQIWGSQFAQREVWRANNPYHKTERLCGEDINIFLSGGTGIPGKYEPSPQEAAEQFMRAASNGKVGSLLNDRMQAQLIEASTSLTTHLFETKLRTTCGLSTLVGSADDKGGGIDITTDYTLTGTHSWPYWQDAFHKSWPMLAKSLGVATG